MPSRRAFVAGVMAAGLMPRPSWAEAGNPALLSAAQTPNGRFVLCGLGSDGALRFQLPLPARGHAAAAHPDQPLAVAFARRPGRFAIVLDCRDGRETARLQAPEGRHFYGHGVFSADGRLLFTTENDYAAARGMVGVWDAARGFERVREFPSGGVGPHDIKRLPGTDILVVANGGIETHPETGRAKLNLATMRSNLSYLDAEGQVIEQVRLGPEHQRGSIRHLAVAGNGTVAFAMQWQGDLNSDLPLLGLHHRLASKLEMAEDTSVRATQGYLGSVAMSRDGRRTVTTSPRAGVALEFEGARLVTRTGLADVCGVAAADAGFTVTTGMGRVRPAVGAEVIHPLAWDNHLVTI
ncbi:MAG: DUF1513 domain-containing protein [Pseudomonadota bacterium]